MHSKLNMMSAAVAAALSLTACSVFAQGQQVLPVTGIEFTSTPAPKTAAEQQTAYTTSSVVVTLANGAKKTFPLNYHVLYSSGDNVGDWQGGLIVDNTGKPLMAMLDDAGNALTYGPFYARSPDANSLVVQGDALNLITHFEYDTETPSATDPNLMVDLYGQLPMVMQRAELKQHRDGSLVAKELFNVSMHDVNGLWIPCAGELTPWNTHIGGEEYEPDARFFATHPLTPMNRFLGTTGLTASQGGANAYNYGLATEVKLVEHDKAKVTKHYAMGRLANELAHVLPDGRTAYKGDDGRDVILTMFVADHANDMSAGTIYAAQLDQTSGDNGGQFNLNWIKLGHANDAEIAAMVKNGITFADIFETSSVPADGFHPVYVYTGTNGVNSNKLEYLKVKAGMEKAAAFLETRRFAGYMGATAEFTKMEGETSNNADKKLYIAMSYVEKAMLAGSNADRPRDDIRLSGDGKDLTCGIVYQSNLTGGQKDTDGNMINSQWVAKDMDALILGAKKPADQTAYGKYDSCDTDKMANPDNVKYSEALRTLFIGEDSGNHMNNFVWAYPVDSGKLTRIATGRFGQEWTGLAVVDNLNGYSYVLSNVQHPGATSDTAKYKPLMTADGIDYNAFRKAVDERGAVGYYGGLPAIQVVPAKVR